MDCNGVAMPTVRKEARTLQRHLGNTVGPLRVRYGAVTFTVDVLDISIVGVGIIADQELPIGSSFLIECGPKGSMLPTPLTATIRHATQRNGRWVLGCSLSRFLIAEDLDAMA